MEEQNEMKSAETEMQNQTEEKVQNEAEETVADSEKTQTEAANAENPAVNVENLMAVISDLNAKLKESELRAVADVENMRKRKDKEIEDAKKYSISKFAEALLPVIDALEKALESIDPQNEAFKNVFEGISITHKSFMSTIAKFGMEEVNPVDQPFDPNTQHAIQMIDAPEGKLPNSVLAVVQKGYNLNGRNIRPAMVVVAKPQPLDEKV